MKTQHTPVVRRRHLGRFALVASLFVTAFASTAFAQFSVSYTATQFQLFGLAHFERNPLCPDGYMIDQIGFGPANYCTIVVTVPTTGVYNINFQGETEYPRGLFLALGSESGPQSSLSGTVYTGASFKIPVEYSIGTITLNAGQNTLVFFNAATTGKTDRCPYISQVTVFQ
jgi:hypothetical protein